MMKIDYKVIWISYCDKKYVNICKIKASQKKTKNFWHFFTIKKGRQAITFLCLYFLYSSQSGREKINSFLFHHSSECDYVEIFFIFFKKVVHFSILQIQHGFFKNKSKSRWRSSKSNPLFWNFSCVLWKNQGWFLCPSIQSWWSNHGEFKKIIEF